MQRKIIHIDMDCFYAAIEMRDDPRLRDQPVAVGGNENRRGVLCTCNYRAREFGVHSAMPTAKALQLCPNLVVVPTQMEKYKQASQSIREIFAEYTDRIEPLSLDEAYLDVSETKAHQGSATLIAQAIRQQIWQSQQLTASAGIAPNKFLAKVASDWQKPNGQFVVPPDKVEAFVKELPVKKIFGVGKVTQQRMHDLGIHTCADLQQRSLVELSQQFGRFGARLHELARGIDKRNVEPHRRRKSVSVEITFQHDLPNLAACLAQIDDLYQDLQRRLQKHSEHKIHKQFVKIKFFDFQQTTVEHTVDQLNIDTFIALIKTGYARAQKPVRLLGLGVGFAEPETVTQLSLSY